MDRGRLLGIILGLFLVASVFVLPFTYRGARPLTLFEVSVAVAQFRADIPSEFLLLNYSYLVVFALLLAAGILGTHPPVSGVVALLAMASLSIAVYAQGAANWGFGYYLIWGEALAASANGYIARRNSPDRS
jgi:hypothetical protein